MLFVIAAVVVAAAYGSGLALTRGRLPVEDGLLRRLTVFSIGFGALSLLTFLLGLAHAFRPPVLLALTLAGAALVVPFARRELHAARRAWCEAGPLRPLLVAAAAIVAFDVVLAAAPPTSGDAIAYHLSAPKVWLDAGRIEPIWWSWQSFQPFSVQMLYALALAAGSGGAAIVVGALLGAFSAACVYGLTRALVGRRAAAVAALLWVGQGMFLWEATGGFVELVLAGFVALSAWHLVALRRSGRATHAAWAGLALGLAVGTKYHGLVFAPALAALALWAAPAGRRVVSLAAFAALAAVALPWYLRNWIVTGNPVYPFAHGVFGGRYLDAAAVSDLDQSLVGLSLPGLWRLAIFPIEFLRHPNVYERGYSFSPALFLLPLAALVIGGRTVRLLGLGILAYLVVWWEALHQVTRYLLPVLPFAAVLAGCAAVVLWDRGGIARRAVQAVAVVTAVPLLAITGLFAYRVLPGALGIESRAAYVQRQTGTYDALQWLDRELPPQGRVLVGLRNAYWLDRPYAVFDLTLFNFGQPTDEAIARMRRHDVRYLAFLDGTLPTPLEPLRPRLRELARLDVPYVTSRTLGRIEGREVVVWAWCGAEPSPCDGEA